MSGHTKGDVLLLKAAERLLYAAGYIHDKANLQETARQDRMLADKCSTEAAAIERALLARVKKEG